MHSVTSVIIERPIKQLKIVAEAQSAMIDED